MVPHLQNGRCRIDALMQKRMFLFGYQIAREQKRYIAVTHAVHVRQFVARNIYRARWREKYFDGDAVHVKYFAFFSCDNVRHFAGVLP